MSDLITVAVEIDEARDEQAVVLQVTVALDDAERIVNWGRSEVGLHLGHETGPKIQDRLAVKLLARD